MQPTNLNTLAESQSAPGARPLDQEWSLIDCGRALYRRKVLVGSIVSIGMLVAMLASALQTPMYRSHASIQIQGLNENFLNLRDIYPTAAPSPDNAVYIQTQAEILRQDALLDEVIKKLRLDQRLASQSRFGRWAKGGAQSSAAELDELKKNVQIVPTRGSSIIQIVCDAREPGLAADLANTLAQTFIEQSVEARRRSAQQTELSLSREREALGKKLIVSEDQLRAYDRRAGESTSYTALKREIDTNHQFYDVISRRIDEARVASAMDQSNIRIVSPARPAALPFKPNLPLNLALGAVGGLLLAIGYILFREQTNSVWRAPGEAGAWLAIPELGAIPKAASRRFAAFGFGQGFPAAPDERLWLDQPSSGMSESFRAATASILSAGQNGDHPHVLVVTSSRPGEGKTTVVSNLAVALTEIGGKVLLIDGDLRRPRLHKLFHQPNSWGLSDLLREKNAIEDLPLETLVKRTAVPRLHLLPGGTSADNIFALLWSARMARLLPRFRQAFDYVLIDAPPCLEFADARIVGRYAEKLILVVRADYTGRQTAQAAVQRLLLDGLPVMGVIFNGWDPSKSNAYGYNLCHQELA